MLGIPAVASARIRDLWRHQDLPASSSGAVAVETVPPRDVVALRITPIRDMDRHSVAHLLV